MKKKFVNSINKGSIFSHFNERGEASMVDVGEKPASKRRATAQCEVQMKPETFRALKDGSLKKGDAFTVAKTAGILAAKRTFELIPLCHPLALDHIEIRFLDLPHENGVSIECIVSTSAKTGVEMEALTGSAVAALTLYDMAKSSDPTMVISHICLVEKQGGKNDYTRSSCDHNRK